MGRFGKMEILRGSVRTTWVNHPFSNCVFHASSIFPIIIVVVVVVIVVIVTIVVVAVIILSAAVGAAAF